MPRTLSVKRPRRNANLGPCPAISAPQLYRPALSQREQATARAAVRAAMRAATCTSVIEPDGIIAAIPIGSYSY